MFDGLGEVVCHYQQKSLNSCGGISMEWLRRVILKGKETLSSTLKTHFLLLLSPAEVEKLKKKEERWKKTQTGIDDNLRAALLLNRATSTVDPTTREELDDLAEVKRDLEIAKKADKIGVFIPVSDKLSQFAKSRSIPHTSNKLLPAQLRRVENSLASMPTIMRDRLDVKACNAWMEECPIEMGVFKECSKDLENQCFDAKGIELRARFDGLKVVDGANKLTVNTVRAFDAMKAALTNPQFTVKRGLMFCVWFKNQPGHANAVYYGQGQGNSPKKFLWLDPNYGVWRMSLPDVIRAVRFLYDGENAVYKKNYECVPEGFQYSIWEKA
jgi:hypothetical protein